MHALISDKFCESLLLYGCEIVCIVLLVMHIASLALHIELLVLHNCSASVTYCIASVIRL